MRLFQPRQVSTKPSRLPVRLMPPRLPAWPLRVNPALCSVRTLGSRRKEAGVPNGNPHVRQDCDSRRCERAIKA